MNLSQFFRWPLACVLAFMLPGARADEPDPGQIEISVGRLLEQGHFSRKKLDDTMSKAFLKNYLEGLDYNHLYFTQKDIDQFTAKYATSLDDDVLFGNTEPAFAIYDLYKKRVEDRVGKVKELLKQQYDFKSDKTIEVNRQKAAWPKDEAAADQLWRDRLEGELLQEKLNKTDKDPVERLTKRYDQLVRNLREQSKEDVVKIFLTVLAQTYDPHSEYMSKSELDNFQINMKLSLVGIGAVLRSEDGFAQIMELVPGGPAAKDGRIKVGDRVSAVAQGDKEFVDTVDMKLDKVVEMIRGKKDTVVRLQVWPVSATDPSERKIVDITRDEIKLKEQEAKAEIIEHSRPDGTQRLGVITLPSFYADMEHSGASNAKSTTKDVLLLLNRLKQEGISGLVIDLRRNGGGSLEEAVNLTGLFIKKGPVVQSIGNAGDRHVSRDNNSLLAYDGPLVVLTNRLSASASEIFAAALQDYGRAVVVGDSSTFGKGTVQTMLEIGRIMPFLGSSGNEAGALKLTIQKFYRIAGGSTQLNGVEPDVKLPSAYDHPEIGERALKGPLPYDTVDPLTNFEKWDKPLFKKELRDRSTARIATEPEFSYIREDLDLVKKRIAENRISLNIDKRKKEMDEDKTRKEQRAAERAKLKPSDEKRYSITLDNVSKPELQIAKNEKKATADKPGVVTAKEPKVIDPSADPDDEDEDKPEVDAIRTETLAILTDFIDIARNPKAATAATAAK